VGKRIAYIKGATVFSLPSRRSHTIMAPPALLLVFVDPGENITAAEFQDWYDNEHIPLRVNTSTFLNWTRLKAVDGVSPPWVALYDLTSYDDTLKAPYTTLVEKRSEREKGIFSRARLFDRRIYELYEGGPLPPPSALYDETKPAPYMTIVGIDVKAEVEEEFNKGYDEERLPQLAKVPGWIRTRRFVLKEAGRVGLDAEKEHKPVCKYLTVTEWTSLDGLGGPGAEVNLNDQWIKSVAGGWEGADQRNFKFHKDWQKDSRTGDILVRALSP